MARMSSGERAIWAATFVEARAELMPLADEPESADVDRRNMHAVLTGVHAGEVAVSNLRGLVEAVDAAPTSDIAKMVRIDGDDALEMLRDMLGLEESGAIGDLEWRAKIVAAARTAAAPPRHPAVEMETIKTLRSALADALEMAGSPSGEIEGNYAERIDDLWKLTDPSMATVWKGQPIPVDVHKTPDLEERRVAGTAPTDRMQAMPQPALRLLRAELADYFDDLGLNMVNALGLTSRWDCARIMQTFEIARTIRLLPDDVSGCQLTDEVRAQANAMRIKLGRELLT